MGSTSSLTPRFSMQVSPSWICSSNSKPYCSPEQPPPCTNTRSMSFGFPSPRMRSPTLRAAASVKLSAGASCSASVVLIISLQDGSLEAVPGAVKAGVHTLGANRTSFPMAWAPTDLDIAVHARGLADQGVDARRFGLACEHQSSDRAL